MIKQGVVTLGQTPAINGEGPGDMIKNGEVIISKPEKQLELEDGPSQTASDTTLTHG